MIKPREEKIEYLIRVSWDDQGPRFADFSGTSEKEGLEYFRLHAKSDQIVEAIRRRITIEEELLG